MFSHMANDVDISPLPELSHLSCRDALTKYKKMTSYEKLIEELTATGMTSDVSIKHWVRTYNPYWTIHRPKLIDIY